MFSFFSAIKPVGGEGSPPAHWHGQKGFSLVEVLLLITLLSATILPFTIMMTQTAKSSKSAYIQSSRSILLNSLLAEASVDRNFYSPTYTQFSMSTTVTESGQVIPTRLVVDTTNSGASDTFQKTVYFYLYNYSTDAANAPRYKTKVVLKRDVMRVRFDASTYGFTDASGQWWEPQNTYDATNLIPGYTATPNKGFFANSIINLPSHFDAELYQSGIWRTATSLGYSVPASTGMYTVKIYFNEISANSARLIDISLEGKVMNPNTPFSAYQNCGSRYYCGGILMYDVYVSDGTLNVLLNGNTSATNTDPFIAAIMVKKRT
jgi:Tfp pilus assembly protein PilV